MKSNKEVLNIIKVSERNMWAVGRAAIRAGTRLSAKPANQLKAANQLNATNQLKAANQVRPASQAVAADAEGLLISDSAVNR